MIAFHGKEEIKQKYLARVMAHKDADEIIKGTYWEHGKGCAVGCTIHGSKHSDYEKELGIPIWLAYVEDKLFENLPNKKAMQWPLEFLESINIGADLNKIKIPFLIFIVESARDKFDHKKYPKQLAAIENVLIELKKTPVDLESLRMARAAAYAAADAAYAAADADAAAYAADAAAYAAYAAADADAAAYAADAAAYAADAADAAYAAYAAYAAAYAAADADAADADAAYAAAYAAADAREKEYVKFADKLLELIRECK